MSFAPATQDGELWNAYDDPSVPLGRLLALLWMSGDAGGWLSEQLSAEICHRCMRIAERGGDRREAVKAARHEAYVLSAFASTHAVGAELVRHAVVRSLSPARFACGSSAPSAATEFVAELVGVTTEHLAWKDLAGLVGLVGRVRTIPEAERLEADLAGLARDSVLRSPTAYLADAEHVGTTVQGLKRGLHAEGRVGGEEA